MNYSVSNCNNGVMTGSNTIPGSESMSPEAATAAAVAVMAHGLRQQMQMAAVQHHTDQSSHFNIPGGHLTINPSSSGGGLKGGQMGSPSSAASSNGNLQRLESPTDINSNTNLSLNSEDHRDNKNSPHHHTHHHSSSSHHHHSISVTQNLTTTPTSGMNIQRISPPSPIESAHDLRISSPDENNSINSPVEQSLVEPAVNLAVSGLAYKTRGGGGYSSPLRQDNTFPDDINDFGTTGRNLRIGNFKDPTNIKIEPITECRGD